MSEATAELQAWAEAFAALEPGHSKWDLREQRRFFAERMRDLASDSSKVALSENQWDNLAARTAETAAGILWDDEESFAFREALLATLTRFVARAAANTPNEHFGIGFFWDVIAIEARLFDITALPGIAFQANSQSPRMIDALFAALGDQLQMSDKQLELSALRGLSQLGHPRTAELIRSVIERLADDEVRVAANRAARSELV